MAKISILAGLVEGLPTTEKVLESFTAVEGMEIVEIYACAWDTTGYKPMDGRVKVALYEMKGESKAREILEPTMARVIAELDSPLKIQHHPEKGNTIKLVASSPASEAIAYLLRVATA